METLVFKNTIGESAGIIKGGGLVAVPTETVYGLAANGLDSCAVEQIYEVKGRPSIKPLSLMVCSPDDIERYCINVPKQAYALAERFWPGPLTLVLRAKDDIPGIVLAGGTTVGLRCPDSSLTLQLIREAGVPLAAPSANPSGGRSPRSAADVLEYFDGEINAVIDGGDCCLGVESTILDMSSAPYRILRQGALQEKTIRRALLEELSVIGITGGSGSGKTTALHCLESYGALIIDCDDLYHQMLLNDYDLKNAVADSFPGAMTAGGEIDRKALAELVFSDKDALRSLNAVTHRYISERIKQILEEYAFSGGRLAALDAVELISSGLAGVCDFTVAVISSRENRIKRIMERDGLSSEEAEQRINAQKSDTYYIENSNHVLYNDSTVEEFENKCNHFFGGLINE